MLGDTTSSGALTPQVPQVEVLMLGTFDLNLIGPFLEAARDIKPYFRGHRVHVGVRQGQRRQWRAQSTHDLQKGRATKHVCWTRALLHKSGEGFIL